MIICKKRWERFGLSFLLSNKKKECFGCEACVQICSQKAIFMKEDEEGFLYPYIDKKRCVNCGLCYQVCPHDCISIPKQKERYVFGGYIYDKQILFRSTSGGAFSAIVDVFCDKDYVIFGAESKGLVVWHSYVWNKTEIEKFRKSKYMQSSIGDAYIKIAEFLKSGKKVIFSGTPCQIAGLKAYLKKVNQDKLLTIEVICEGVPSPLYIRKYAKEIEKDKACSIKQIDYRYKGHTFLGNYKWDFEGMEILLYDANNKGCRKIKKDRWFNPFWSIWLQHLMSRPSCYECPFAQPNRIADITLGDLWGVHIYCPDLYGKNGGSSLVIGNSNKGKDIVKKAQMRMYGRELDFDEVIKYQSSMRNHISQNRKRTQFMKELQTETSIKRINKKWAEHLSFRLLCQKYLWGNRQKVWLWNIYNYVKLILSKNRK